MGNSQCEGSGCFQMFLKNIVNTTVISVDQIGVVPWCIFWWFIWFFIRTIYKKCFQALLERIAVSEYHSEELMRLYWSIAFTSITVPFTLHHLKLSYCDLSDRFYYVLENHISRWFLTDPTPSVQAKLSYVIIAGFYLNNICEVCFRYGLYSKEFVMNELFGLFFIATFPLRCVPYGLGVMTIINGVDFFLLLSNLFSCFCDIAQTKSLRVFVYVFLFSHSLLWFFAYFYILPVYLMPVAIKKMKLASDVRQISMFILLICSLFGHYILALFTSPVSSMIFNYVRNSEITLFRVEHVVKDNSPMKEMEEEIKQKKKENLLMLYHTVKCVIRIKRKLAKMRKEKKTEQQLTSDNSLDENLQSHVTLEEVSENDSAVENTALLSTDYDEETSEINYTEDIQFSDGEYTGDFDDGEYSMEHCRELSRDDLQVELTN